MQIHPAFAPLVDLIYPPRCPLCGAAIGGQAGLCSDCWLLLEPPGEGEEGVTAGVLYNDAARDLVLRFKHGGRIALAPMLAGMINARLGRLEGDWLAVPVPLHRMRLWHRGFNQSALLARELARAAGCAVLVDGLLRKRPTPMLGGLGREQREAALAGAIALNPARLDRLRGASVLLVDDVFTSGATTRACIAALRQAGAGEVRIACFAQVRD